MPKIHILPPHIANQIAAGEVVERPASIVRELLENSIDAGAKRIRVELEDGGKHLIMVTDDGVGLEKEDIDLAVERHATSKIKDEADLAIIRTMGFRGEALSSIGAVSRLSITSRPSDNIEGWRARMDFGRGKKTMAVGCPFGTTVKVEDLFLEIPARRRFLKRRQTELGHISQIVRTLSVGFPEILFELLSDGREIFRSRPGCQGSQRLWPLVGDQLVFQMLPVEGKSQEILVSGYVTPPKEARASSKSFYFFLNQRPINSRLLWKALNQAFRGFMMKNSYPMGALFLEVQPNQVDVNVHPAKQEVRFHNSDAIYRIVYHSVQRALEDIKLVASPFGKTQARLEETGLSIDQQELDILPDAFQVSEALPAYGEFPSSGQDQKTALIVGPEPSVSNDQGYHVHKSDKAHLWQDFHVLGQLAKSYILAEGPDGLVLVDQHAAHEALIFKRLNKQIARNDALNAQPLVFPEVMERNQEDIAKLPEICPILNRLGVVIESFGHSQIAIRAVPDFVASCSKSSEVVSGLIDRILSFPEQDVKGLVHDLLASMACHSAIKANHHLELQEMKALLKELVYEEVTHCPHGRPVSQVLGFGEIERRFGRKR
ncbi:MAG: DNA mismatch repair endonuclease MutL [Deltaproteobacteria bacterium]|nr:DNA mismatch repair endonuclease MutL [Deltaproteobacteria bacterium]